MPATNGCSLTIAPKALSDALAAVKPAVATRCSIAALHGVRILTVDGSAYLETTDLDVAVRRRIDAQVHGECDTLVAHADMAKAAKLFAKRERVTLTASEPAKVDGYGRDVTVSDEQRSITLPGLKLADWPRLPTETGRALITGASDVMATLIERAAAFASSDDTRPVLTGVCFDYGRGRVVATDSYRLGVLDPGEAEFRRAREDRSEAGTINVSARGLVMAAKAMRKAPGGVTVSTSDNGRRAIVRFADDTWTTRIIEGQFPNWSQLLPEEDVPAPLQVTVPVAELTGACEVAKAFCRRNAPMRLSVNGNVKVTGLSYDGPSFAELLPGASHTGTGGEEFTIGLSPEFVADIARAHRGDTAHVRLITPMRPALFIDEADRYLLMPIRLGV